MTPTDPKRTVPGPDVHAYDRFHAEHGHAEHDGLYNEDVAHEYSDVNVRALLLSAAGLVAVVLVCAAAMYVLFGVFERMAAASDRAVTPLAGPAVAYPPGAAPTLLPPEPRLLTNEPQNLARVRAGEAANLQGIDEAKKQLLQQGLPVRADASTDSWLGTHAPARGESSGGRGILTRPAAPGQDEPQPAASQPAAQGTTPPKSGGH